MAGSFWELLLVVVIVLVLFGAGKLPRVMGDLGKGIRSLKEGMKGEEESGLPRVDAVKDASKPPLAEQEKI